MYINRKKIINEVLVTELNSVSDTIRKWSSIISKQYKKTKNDIIIKGRDYPELYDDFSVDYFVIQKHNSITSYLEDTSGIDKDGNYVVHLTISEMYRDGDELLTVLNHELKHAFEDWKRQSKGSTPMKHSKEIKTMYTGDFIKLITGQISVKPYDGILMLYYYTSKFEQSAFIENIYDKSRIGDEYIKYIKLLINFDKENYIKNFKTYLEKNFIQLKKLDIPFIKRFDDYMDFLTYTEKFFHKRGNEIKKKINKMKYKYGLSTTGTV